MNLKVCGHRVLIRPDSFNETVEEGALKGFQLDVGDGFKREKAATVIGTIVAIGETAWKDFSDGRPWAKIGDKIYYAKYSGKIVKDSNDTEYVIINDEDCQAIILEESKDD